MHMQNKNILFLLFLMTLVVVSCKKDEVTFSQSDYDGQVAHAFPVSNVDASQTWVSIATATARLTVSDGSGTTYRFRIYNANPLDGSQSLTLLSEGTVADGSTVSQTFSYTPGQLVVYVALFDGDGYMSVYPGTVTGGVLTLQVARPAAAAGVKRRAITPGFTFADPPADADFKTSIPSDALLPSGYTDATKGSLHNYKLAETTSVQQLNFWNGNFALYVSGERNVQFNNPGDGSKDMYFYILPGAHLTFKNNAFTLNSSNNFKMYVCEGATVTFEAGLQSYMALYNRGTVEVKGGYKPGIYGAGIFYNQGTFTIKGAQSYYVAPESVENPLTLNNAQSQFINDGTLNAGGVIVEGSAHFINNGTATLTSNTVVNSNNATWVNNGTYTTNKFYYTAGSTDVINNCKLIVKDLFKIGLGDTDKNGFQLDGGASVVTKNFEFEGPGFIFMGSDALFQVTNTAKFAINKDTYGIYGPTSGNNAIFQAKRIERLRSWETNQCFSANYFRRLYVACDYHFPAGYSDKNAWQISQGQVGSQPYYRLDSQHGASMTTYQGAKANLSDAGCGAAYQGTPGGTPASKPLTYRYLFEDNFPDTGDYDFNDCVISLSPSIDNSGKLVTLTVKAEASGAQKCIGAAVRLVGITTGMLRNYNCTQRFSEPPSEVGEYKNIPGGDFATSKDPNDKTSMVLLLFKDLHWVLNPVKADNGGINRLYYNTQRPGMTNYATAPVRTASFVFEFNNKDDAQKMFDQATYDAFIVESHNGNWWEVHTVQNGRKGSLVLHPDNHLSTLQQYQDAYVNSKSGHIPWAVVVPGTVAYPYEWVKINTAYPQFTGWAQNRQSNTLWYTAPASGQTYPLP